MKKVMLLSVLFVFASVAFSQSKTTQALDERFEGLSLYFYKNTLRMLNQKDDPDFDELIKNIEKMKFVMVDKREDFAKQDYTQLVNDYKAESFEEMMTSRHEGRTFDVYIKDKKGSSLGTVILVNDSTSLYVLDIIGTIDMRKASSLFSAIDESSDIGKQIKNFTKGDRDKKHRGVKID
jgi:hypothetical protein